MTFRTQARSSFYANTDRPHHDHTIMVTGCGRICFRGHKVNVDLYNARQWDLWKYESSLKAGFCKPELEAGRGAGGRGGRAGGAGAAAALEADAAADAEPLPSN